ncbi:hypothetical protein BVY04_01590 [bacterium M21]|nr:hypothetical protein BVY04_01590 [bacterium M21]
MTPHFSSLDKNIAPHVQRVGAVRNRELKHLVEKCDIDGDFLLPWTFGTIGQFNTLDSRSVGEVAFRAQPSYVIWAYS